MKKKGVSVINFFVVILLSWALILILFHYIGVSGLTSDGDPYTNDFTQTNGLVQLWKVMSFQVEGVSTSLSIFLDFYALLSIVIGLLIIRGNVA